MKDSTKWSNVWLFLLIYHRSDKNTWNNISSPYFSVMVWTCPVFYIYHVQTCKIQTCKIQEKIQDRGHWVPYKGTRSTFKIMASQPSKNLEDQIFYTADGDITRWYFTITRKLKRLESKLEYICQCLFEIVKFLKKQNSFHVLRLAREYSRFFNWSTWNPYFRHWNWNKKLNLLHYLKK